MGDGRFVQKIAVAGDPAIGGKMPHSFGNAPAQFGNADISGMDADTYGRQRGEKLRSKLRKRQ